MSSIATSQEAKTSPHSAAFAPTAAIVAAPGYEAQERAGDLRLDAGIATIELVQRPYALVKRRDGRSLAVRTTRRLPACAVEIGLSYSNEPPVLAENTDSWASVSGSLDSRVAGDSSVAWILRRACGDRAREV